MTADERAELEDLIRTGQRAASVLIHAGAREAHRGRVAVSPAGGYAGRWACQPKRDSTTREPRSGGVLLFPAAGLTPPETGALDSQQDSTPCALFSH